MRRPVFAALLLLSALPLFAARLPKGVVPTHYALSIAPNLADETFTGEERIEVDVKEPVDAITLNSVDIDITDVTVTSGDKTLTPAVSVDAANQTVSFKLGATLPPGKATIHDRFSAKLNQKLRGLYVSRTPKRKYAVTQFESTDARRAFPSFDEPAFKATYDITLVVDAGDTAISNAPIASDTPAAGGKHAIRFATTKKMSSYLVAMLVGDFRCIQGGTDGIPIRVCSTPGMENLGHFALSAAEASVKFYDGYFGIKYPFGKLDLIGIPDFEAGAMENAGAVTFRETDLLVDDQASIEAKKGVARTVAHEIAHMWFGDLVTMAWWDDIWLNEGFATFMTRKPLEVWHPEWRVDLDAVGGTMQSLNLDSQRATRAIRTHVETPEEINQLFDGIAYRKTAAVLRMVETLLGRDAFRDAIRAYLTKYSWSNAAAEDFWGTMTESSKRPVDAVMKSFVEQPGAPLLHVTESCNGGVRSVKIDQERLSIAGKKLEGSSWTLPLCPRGDACRVLGHGSETITLSGCDAPLFLSRDGAGYFAVDYPAEERARLRARLADLSAAERLSLRGNEWLLTRDLREDVGEYLALVRAMPRPEERPLVDAIAGSLEFLDQRLITDAHRAAWQRFVQEALRGYTPLTWQPVADESSEQRIARAQVLATVGDIARDPQVLAGAKTIAEQYMKNPASVDAVIADRALPLAAAGGDAAFYERVLERVNADTTPEEHARYLGLLTEFHDPALIKRTIDYIFSDKTRTQDLPRMIAGMMFNPAARDMVWGAVKERWSDIEKKIPTALGNITGSTAAFCDAGSKKDVEAFFAAHPPKGGERGLRRALESIDSCIAFREKQQKSFEAALAP